MRFCLLALILVSLSAQAQIYQYTDSQGNKVYTNQPPSGVESRAVELNEPNSIQAIELPAPPTQSQNQNLADAYSLLALRLPEDVVRANNGSFSVPVTIEPALAPTHRLQLLVNGAAHGPAIHGQVLEAVNLPRGELELAVAVLSQGKVIQRSAVQSVSVQRVHTQSPALRPTPLPRVIP